MFIELYMLGLSGASALENSLGHAFSSTLDRESKFGNFDMRFSHPTHSLHPPTCIFSFETDLTISGPIHPDMRFVHPTHSLHWPPCTFSLEADLTISGPIHPATSEIRFFT